MRAPRRGVRSGGKDVILSGAKNPPLTLSLKGSILQFNIYKIIPLALFAVYGLSCALSPSSYGFMDRVDLVFHEAGHAIFRVFGWEFLMVLGGTLMQLIMPAAITAYFFINGQRFSSGVTGIWLAQSIFNVSVYAKDAWDMELPLLGGEDSIHDWNYMLNSLGLLGHAELVSNIIYITGFSVLVFSLALGVYNSKGVQNG